MGHGLRLDYAKHAKRGFVFGVVRLIIGAIGSPMGPNIVWQLPDWEQTVLFDFMWIGILIEFSPSSDSALYSHSLIECRTFGVDVDSYVTLRPRRALQGGTAATMADHIFMSTISFE